MESHEKSREIWETETALITEVLKTEGKLKTSYRRWAAEAIYPFHLYILPCVFTSDQVELLANLI